MSIHICYGPEMAEMSRYPLSERWCFHCRARRQFLFIVMAPVGLSYYGPHTEVRCETCDTLDGDCFPGTFREGGE